ncbi:MAG TPA: hypothetical protein VLF39_04585 [Candidatus Saccharimonadales bacterium]|nr:hypothetical protein [Candidatus Saccharimonadales bacterium]
MKKLNTKGFSAIEGLLILVIVGLIGFVGWYVWKSQKDTTKTLNDTNQGVGQTAKTTNSFYNGWKMTCDSNVKACYKHPTDWVADQYNTGLENPAQTEYVSLTGPTIKDGGSGSAYIVSIDDLNPAIVDLKILGTIVDNRPNYSIYNASYISSNNIKVGATQDIDYTNHRFTGKTGEAGFDATPDSKGYASIKTLDQAKAWFNSDEAKTVLKVIQSFKYQ